MKSNCEYCGNENPKNGMKTCSRKCNDELKKINSREKRDCLFCKKEFEVRKKDSKKLCSEVCRKQWSILPENINKRIEALKLSVNEKFGVDNVFQLSTIKDKSKETKIKLYGDENYNNPDKMHITKKEKYGYDYGKDWYKTMSAEMMKNYGVNHPLKTKKFIDKLKNTNLEKYGFEWGLQNINVKNKLNQLIKERFGVENISQNESIKQKKKDTSIKNFGVSHHLKDYNMFQKHQKERFGIEAYKSTKLYYNGSYEKYFLELIEEKGLLNEVQPGHSFKYKINEKEHVYHSDFFFRGKNIEIKSGWTYNKNGNDQELQNINESKWQSVKDSNEIILILMSKEEIKGFVKAL